MFWYAHLHSVTHLGHTFKNISYYWKRLSIITKSPIKIIGIEISIMHSSWYFCTFGKYKERTILVNNVFKKLSFHIVNFLIQTTYTICYKCCKTNLILNTNLTLIIFQSLFSRSFCDIMAYNMIFFLTFIRDRILVNSQAYVDQTFSKV